MGRRLHLQIKSHGPGGGVPSSESLGRSQLVTGLGYVRIGKPKQSTASSLPSATCLDAHRKREGGGKKKKEEEKKRRITLRCVHKQQQVESHLFLFVCFAFATRTSAASNPHQYHMNQGRHQPRLVLMLAVRLPRRLDPGLDRAKDGLDQTARSDQTSLEFQHQICNIYIYMFSEICRRSSGVRPPLGPHASADANKPKEKKGRKQNAIVHWWSACLWPRPLVIEFRVGCVALTLSSGSPIDLHHCLTRFPLSILRFIHPSIHPSLPGFFFFLLASSPRSSPAPGVDTDTGARRWCWG